jgi:predicted extracellular nuclease
MRRVHHTPLLSVLGLTLVLASAPLAEAAPTPTVKTPPKVGRYLRHRRNVRRDPRREISYVSFNVQNLFRYRPRPGSAESFSAGQNNRSRKQAKRANYLPASRQEYKDKVQKVAKEIVKLGKPDLVSLQEIENFKKTKRRDHSVLADLVKAIKEQTAGSGDVEYKFAFSHGVSDRRGISNAFLYRADRVKLDGADPNDPLLGHRQGYREGLSLNKKVANPKSLNGRATTKVKGDKNGSLTLSRPLLVGRFTVFRDGVGSTGPKETLYVFNNHMKSQPHRFHDRRSAQSKLLATEVKRLLGKNPGAKVLVSGDMNVDLNQRNHRHQLRTMENLTSANPRTPTLLDNLTAKMKEGERFSYTYRKKHELLDWVYASPNLANKLLEVRIPHHNSLATDKTKRSSDHDPVLTRFAAFE